MTVEDFISNLTAKFRSKEDQENRVFFSDLSSFVDSVKPDCLQDIYNQITMEHTFATIPRMAKFWKIARKGKFLLLKPVVMNPYWNVCINCKTIYSKHGRGCPKCRCTSASIESGETLPEKIVEVQEDCFYCSIYTESVKKENERKLYFTGCVDYGIKQNAQCTACNCKECCRQMMMYNADPVGTTEKYKTTELAQPWIRECPELPDTAQKMIDHMTGRRR